MKERLVYFGKYKKQRVDVLLQDKPYCQYLLTQPWMNEASTDIDLHRYVDIRDRILRVYPDFIKYVPQQYHKAIPPEIGNSIHSGSTSTHTTHSLAWGMPKESDQDPEETETDDDDGFVVNGEVSSEEEEDDTVSEDAQFEVEKVLAHKFNADGSCTYLLKWKGYADEENSWESEENVSYFLLFGYWKECWKNKYHQIRAPAIPSFKVSATWKEKETTETNQRKRKRRVIVVEDDE
jgi:hypothetical protein